MSCLQDNVSDSKLVKGENGVVKVLQVAHSGYWGIWGRLLQEEVNTRRLRLRPFCAKNVTISYVLASRILTVATHLPVR